MVLLREAKMWRWKGRGEGRAWSSETLDLLREAGSAWSSETLDPVGRVPAGPIGGFLRSGSSTAVVDLHIGVGSGVPRRVFSRLSLESGNGLVARVRRRRRVECPTSVSARDNMGVTVTL